MLVFLWVSKKAQTNCVFCSGKRGKNLHAFLWLFFGLGNFGNCQHVFVPGQVMRFSHKRTNVRNTPFALVFRPQTCSKLAFWGGVLVGGMSRERDRQTMKTKRNQKHQTRERKMKKKHMLCRYGFHLVCFLKATSTQLTLLLTCRVLWFFLFVVCFHCAFLYFFLSAWLFCCYHCCCCCCSSCCYS